MKEKIEIIRSDRKTVAVEITQELRVIVRAPRRMQQEEVEAFLQEKTPWIEAHMERMRARMASAEAASAAPFTEAELWELGERAAAVIPPRVDALARTLGVTYGRITIRNQVSRWGSCTSEGNLNFNCLLMLCPDEVVEYVIIHELCHRRHMNHSRAFWAMVETYCPAYKHRLLWLKENGGPLIMRLRAGR